MSGPPPTNLRNQFPSMASVSSMQSLLSMGYLPPGHGYVPKKQKPDKPYGVSFISRMNRTIRGPGRKNLNYALTCFITAIFFFMGAALFLGHRNVSRMIVYRLEVFGPLMVLVGLCLISLTAHYVTKARRESNKWRYNIRFHPEGLFTAAAFNDEYVPDLAFYDDLRTGTYGPKALKEIPKPKAMKKKKKKKRRAQSKESLLSEDSLDSGNLTPGAGDPHYIPQSYAGYAVPMGRSRGGGSMERILEEGEEPESAPAHPGQYRGGAMYAQPAPRDAAPRWGQAAQPQVHYNAPRAQYATPDARYETPWQGQYAGVDDGYDLPPPPPPQEAYYAQPFNPATYQPPPGLEESEL